jgi:excisionase family DNA binding protein
VLTVPQAARRVGRNPETVRRWIRAGRLRASKVGTQHVIEEGDLDAVVAYPSMLPMPEEWRRLDSGEPAPNWVEAIREGRRDR